MVTTMMECDETDGGGGGGERGEEDEGGMGMPYAQSESSNPQTSAGIITLHRDAG